MIKIWVRISSNKELNNKKNNLFHYLRAWPSLVYMMSNTYLDNKMCVYSSLEKMLCLDLPENSE